MFRKFIREFVIFGIKQANACLFAGMLLAVILGSHWWYPITAISRYDFLFLFALAVQVILLAARLESLREAGVIIVFHLLATGMELFKTSDAIGAWHYPETFRLGFHHVPFFAGFMYSAVGSYIARVWRIFDFKFSHYPPRWPTVIVAGLIYVNFFTHHYVWDIRWLLFVAVFVMYGRSWIYFKVDKKYRRMPLLMGWFLVAVFIWFAENLGTFGNVWLYPNQKAGWQMVPLTKLAAWLLLLILSFVLVSLVHRPAKMSEDEG
ncbi:DUF817 domain-containing protein [Zavarzinella formosa]|uniref:DUF817 domain-containing protein n=1 Tax=Zavarzinella formosa TaxID=360055 RepID=UPI000305CE20|nr:DUF817 domain-containing protein [Zavarzinella formosa]